MVLAKANQRKRGTFSHAFIGEHTLITLKHVLTTYPRKQFDALALLDVSTLKPHHAFLKFGNR